MKIFATLLDFLPPWVPFAVAGVLMIGLTGGFVALKASWEAEGAARAVAADRQAVIDQKERDAALSAAIINQQAEQLAALSIKANTIVRRIDHAPKTTGCGPVMRDTSRGLHELFGSAGQPPAGREPAFALPGPGTSR